MKKSIALLLVTVLLLASVISIFAAQAEGSTKSVAPDELIATFDVNTGAVYAGATHTILARIGENKTITDITGYLDASRDYNYFYVYAAEADADGNYVITAEYEVLGRPDGVKSDVEVPENGFLVCLHAGDEAAAPMNEKINVGDIVVLDNVDLDALAALQPGENPIAGTGKASFYTAKEVEDEPAPEQPKVEPDELIAKVDVYSGALYAAGSSTVLARIGENKTIAEVTGYLDASRDYNYFYVYAAEEDANGNYVITEEYETLGRPEGVKSDVEIPENGFLVCLHAGDEAVAPLNEKIGVGNIVVLENIDLKTLSSLEPGMHFDGATASFYTAKEVEDEPADAPLTVHFTQAANSKTDDSSLTLFPAGDEDRYIASDEANIRWAYAMAVDADGTVVSVGQNLLSEAQDTNNAFEHHGITAPAGGFVVIFHTGDGVNTFGNAELRAYFVALLAEVGYPDTGAGNTVVDVSAAGWQAAGLTTEGGDYGFGYVTFYKGAAPVQPIATVDVNTGAIYAAATHTVLARIGENKTVSEVTGYLDASRDYNYFYVYAVEADADGDYVITAEYEVLGRPDGVKSDVEVPENGFLVCLHAGDEAVAPLNETINVGNVVVFEGFDPAVLSALQPGENPIAGTAKVSFYPEKEVEDKPTNVALGKEVDVKRATGPIPQYSGADLTDGVAATTFGWGNPSDEWFSFYYNANYADQVNVELVDGTRIGNAVVDLAGYYDVSSVRVHFNASFMPETAEILVSDDGVNFTSVSKKTVGVCDSNGGTPAEGAGTVNGAGCWVEFTFDAATAQYVKLVVTFPGMFAMLNEIEVYGVPSDDEPEEEWAPSEEGDWTMVTDETGTVQDTNVGVNGLAFAYTVDADIDYVYITFETNGAPHNVDATLDTFDAIRVTGTAIRIYLEVGEAGKFDKLLDTVVIDGKAVAYLAKEATDAYTVTMSSVEGGTRYEFALSVEALGIGETFKMAISYSDKCFGEDGDAYNVLNDHIYDGNADAPWSVDTHYTEYTRPTKWAPSEDANETVVTDETGTVQDANIGVNGLEFAYTVVTDSKYVYITFETNGAPHNVDASLATFDAIRVTGTAIRIYLEVDKTSGKFDRLLDTVVIDGKAVAYLAKEATDAYTVTMSSVNGGTRYEFVLSVEALGIGSNFKMAIAYSDKCFGENGDTYNVLNDHIYDGNADAPWSVDTHYTEYTLPAVPVDYSALEAAIAEAEALNADDYTEESWAELQAALAAAKAGLTSDDQAKVDELAEALRAAIDALVEADEDENTSSDDENTSSDDENTSSDDENTSSDDENTTSSDDENTTSSDDENTSSSEDPSDSKSPETGDSGIVLFAILAVLSLAGAIVAVRVRH